MPLNDVDKSWVREAIQSANQAAAPKRGIVLFLKDWGGLAVIVTVSLFILQQWSEYSSFRGTADLRISQVEKSADKINERVGQVEKSLEKLNDRIDFIQLRQIVSSPINTQNAKLARQIAISAKSEGRAIDPGLVEETGKKLISSSHQVPDAWGTAVQFLNYKSFRNQFSNLIPDSRNATPRKGSQYRGFLPNEGKNPFYISIGAVGTAPINTAAEFHPIGEDPNQNMEFGDAVIFVQSDALQLDNMQMRNVVLKDSRILYDGGPLLMSNVFFVNCTFEVKETRYSQGLLMAALAPNPSTTFSTN